MSTDTEPARRPLDPVALAHVRTLVRSGAARTARIAGGLSYREVADFIGASPATVHRWENGQRMPHGELAVRYGELLDRLLAR